MPAFPPGCSGVAAAAAEASVGFATDSTHTTSKIRSFKECDVLKILPWGCDVHWCGYSLRHIHRLVTSWLKPALPVFCLCLQKSSKTVAIALGTLLLAQNLLSACCSPLQRYRSSCELSHRTQDQSHQLSSKHC